MEPDLRLDSIDRDGAIADAVARLHGHTRADLLRGALFGGAALLAAGAAPAAAASGDRARRHDPQLRADARGAAGGLLHRGRAQQGPAGRAQAAGGHGRRPTSAPTCAPSATSWAPRRSSARTSTSAARPRAPTRSGARRWPSRTWRSRPTRARRPTSTRAPTSPRRWPSTRSRRATPRGSGGWRGKPPVAGPFDEPVSGATAARDRGAHALRHAQHEQQGAQVHRLIAAGRRRARRRGPRRLRRAGDVAAASSARGPRHPRAGARRPADRRAGAACAPTRMPCNGRRCGAPAIARAAPSARRARRRAAVGAHARGHDEPRARARARPRRARRAVDPRAPARAPGADRMAGALGARRLREVHTRLIVDRARLTLTLLRNGRAVFRAPVGIGRAATPTPAGDFYVRDRLRALTPARSTGRSPSAPARSPRR